MEKYEKLEIEVIDFTEGGIWTDTDVVIDSRTDGASFILEDSETTEDG